MQRIISRAKTIPNYFYTCPKMFEKEQNLFRKNFINVGITDFFKNKGQYQCGKIFKDPYFILHLLTFKMPILN